MKWKGSITIYISLILTALIFLFSTIAESARLNVVCVRSRDITQMAVDSVMAGYAQQVYDDYGILLVWENISAEEQLRKYIQANIKMADLNGRGGNFLKTDLEKTEIKSIQYVTENLGKGFVEQVCNYMKYAGTAQAADELKKQYQKYEEKNTDTKENVTKVVGDNTGELCELVDKINDICKKLKDTKDLEQKENTVRQMQEGTENYVKQEKDRQKIMKFRKEWKEFIALLESKSDIVDEAIRFSENYERKKEIFLNENGYTAGEKDYISDNLKILENIRDKIKESRELNVLEFSEIALESNTELKIFFNNIKEIIQNMKSLTVQKSEKENAKDKKIYDTAVQFLNTQILSLVIENVEQISNAALLNSNLPSEKQKEKDSRKTGWNEKSALILYANRKFGNYLSPKKDTVLQYEIEYILNGQQNDKENLAKNIEKIAAVRCGLNMAYLMTDKTKMAEITAVASGVSTAIGLPFLEPIVKGVLTTAWSTAEAVSDIKSLLKGKKIPLIKKKEEWKTSLSNLNADTSSNEKRGLDYQAYCNVLLMMGDFQKYIYREMDLIQQNIQKRYQKEFLMEKCFTRIEIQADYYTQPLFVALPWSLRLLNHNYGGYEYSVDGQGAYEESKEK